VYKRSASLLTFCSPFRPRCESFATKESRNALFVKRRSPTPPSLPRYSTYALFMHAAPVQSHHPGLSGLLLTWTQMLLTPDWLAPGLERRFAARKFVIKTSSRWKYGAGSASDRIRDASAVPNTTGSSCSLRPHNLA